MKFKNFRRLSLIIFIATTLVSCNNNNNNKETNTSNNINIKETQDKSDEKNIPTLIINDEKFVTTNPILVTKDNFLLPYNDISEKLNTQLKVSEISIENEIIPQIEITYLDKDLYFDETPFIEVFYPTSHIYYGSFIRDNTTIYKKDKTKIMDNIAYIPIDYFELYNYYFDQENNKLYLITDIKNTNIDNDIKYKAILNTYQRQFDNFITAINTLDDTKLLGFNMSIEEAPESYTGFSGMSAGLYPLIDDNISNSILKNIDLTNIDKDLLNNYISKVDELNKKAYELALKAEKYYINNPEHKLNEEGKKLAHEIRNVINDAYSKVIDSYTNLTMSF